MLRFFASLLVPLLFAGCAAASSCGDIKVEKIAPADSSVLEEWHRVTTEEDVLGVSASRLEGAQEEWQVFVNAAEFAREEPTQSMLHEAVTQALQNAEGVTAVLHEDREVWIVRGNVRGEALVRSVAPALDHMQRDLERTIEDL
ncbi:hypothetical protein DWG18_02390 [Lysobacter sp. TY2-98]|uniref:hypothetical protein n=1 Tax=Lysobacter sp. TY2-98 TaxID=2290922 RepID=UPI000E1FF428|nr:hypothetical protein [Lysobacter sp. TY2-98]AXK71249.1 hypothetical protein DWG18_02390 [Lysobacter sp. TY2-98]